MHMLQWRFCSCFILDSDWATIQNIPYEDVLNVMVLNKKGYCTGSDKCKTVLLGTRALRIKSAN